MKTLALLASAGFLAAATAPTPVSLVNPGFETPYTAVNLNGGSISGQIANGWSDGSSSANPTVQYAQETSNPHGGTSCQKIVVTSVGSGLVQLQQTAQLSSGGAYTFSAWMRGTTGSIARLSVYRVGGSNNNDDVESDVALTSNWQQVTAVGWIVNGGAFLAAIAVTGPGTVWVDDAALSDIPGTLTPTPNLGVISPSFFGMHVADFQESQLLNPGFEPPYYRAGVNNPVSGDVAEDWTNQSSLSASVVFSLDTNNPHSGATSQKISANLSSAAAQLTQTLSLVPGSTYTLTIWMRGSGYTQVALVGAPPFAQNAIYAQMNPALTSNWQQFSVSGQVNDTGLVLVQILVLSSGTVWVDDVSVTNASGQPVSGGVPWPAVGFGTLRLWNSGTTWNVLEPEKGVFNWEPLDNFVQAAGQHGVNDILLTLGMTPDWASSSPDLFDPGFLGTGATAPPTNIQDWIDYITAVAQRYKGRIRYYEIWNEPDHIQTYSGTVAEMVALTQAAYTTLKGIDPGITVVAPVSSTHGYLDELLAAGMGNYVDVISYHEYTFTPPIENAAQYNASVRLIMAKYGVGNLPLWDTEGAAGNTTTALAVAPETLAQRILVDLAFGSARFNWFIWDQASMYEVATVENDRREVTPAGRAYGYLYGWLAGSTLTQALIDAAGNWQIWVTRPDGTQALVVWNPTQNTPLTLPGTFKPVSSHDLSGGVQSVSGNSVTVTGSPVFLTSTVDSAPKITSVNVAGGGSSLAQNTWIEIRGTNLAPAGTPANGLVWSAAPEFTANLMPTQLGNLPLQVTVNDHPASLYFLCSAANSSCATDQINVLTPLDSTVGPVTIVVYTGIYSASFTVNLQSAAPSFPLAGSTHYVVATHADYSLIGPASLSVPGYPFTPAHAGETVLLYAFGLGLPANPIIGGSALQSGSLPTQPVIQIGGAPATVAFAGLISPGLYQINVVVPAAAPSGDNLITCKLDGATSPMGDLITVQ